MARGIGIGVGQVIALVREAQAHEQPEATIDISGPGSAALADELAAGGAAAAVSVGGNPLGASMAIRILDGPPSRTEIEGLRLLTRHAKPVLVLRPGAQAVPYVLPGDVLEAPGALRPGELAEAIARVAVDDAPALAARLPVIRDAVDRRVVRTAAIANAVLAGSPWMDGAHLPLLSLAQARMLLLLGTTRGVALPRDPQALARSAAPPIVASVAVGVVARMAVRRLPVRGPVVRAAVAFAATRALAATRLRLP